MPTRPPIHRHAGYRTPTQRRAAVDRRRGTAHARGYTRQWSEAAALFRTAHPSCMCSVCMALPESMRDASQVVDHVRPHRGDMRLFWDTTNWQAMSKRHHDAKTAREDGGLGNPSRAQAVESSNAGGRGRKSPKG